MTEQLRRWRFDEEGWVATRRSLTLPADVAAQLPPVPAPTTGGATTATVPTQVEATRDALAGVLGLVGGGPVAVEVVRHRSAGTVVSRHATDGRHAAGMVVATAGSDVGVRVEVGTVDQLLAMLVARLGLAPGPPTTTPAVDGDPVTVDVGALADGRGLPGRLWRAAGGADGSVQLDVVEVDGPFGATAASLLHDEDGAPVWARLEGTSLRLQPTSAQRVRDWLVRAVAAQLEVSGV